MTSLVFVPRHLTSSLGCGNAGSNYIVPTPQQLIQKLWNCCSFLGDYSLAHGLAEVERRLSVVEELEAGVSANLQRATRLRQSILRRAFSGKL